MSGEKQFGSLLGLVGVDNGLPRSVDVRIERGVDGLAVGWQAGHGYRGGRGWTARIDVLRICPRRRGADVEPVVGCRVAGRPCERDRGTCELGGRSRRGEYSRRWSPTRGIGVDLGLPGSRNV